MLRVTVNLEQAAKAISHIPGAVSKAVKTSSRKTLTIAKREAISKVRSRYTSPVSLFTQSLKVKATSYGGQIISTGSRNPLEKFKTAPSGRITTKGSYIKATVVKGQGAIIKKAFRKSSDPAVYERLGRSRFPIHKLKSVAAPSMLNVPQVREPVMQKIETTFPVEFLKEVENNL